MSLEVVFFEIRGRRCALPLSAVREVMAVPNLTPVPMAPSVVRGVAPFHGQALPLLDLGVWLAPGAEPRGESAHARDGALRVLLIEGGVADDGAPLRAALAVDRVMRLGAIDEEHARPAPPGPAFVSATVLDSDGPALLIDAQVALDQVRQAVRAVGRT